jgi:NADH:ubiquinone oxidoreductase subunit F (NADH-binding)/(2Fe-2S) ferredoxin/Pyruvate/2-oxoacid:ferredoxin oxidoreductase delta subunit
MSTSKSEQYRADVLVSCLHDKSPDLMPALEEEVKRRGLEGEVRVVEAGCRGFCSMGPVILIEPEGVFYIGVEPADVPELVEETLVKGRVVERLTYREPETRERIPYYDDLPFHGKQMRVVLRNCGLIDPMSIEEYIAVGGYQALAKVLSEMTPEEVIETVKASGLRGRGGAGFSTGRKWGAGRKAEGEPKYMLVNGDEGDPNCFMDRALMEADPHSVLEGMIIGAYAVGAHEGYWYIPFEHTLSVRSVRNAIEQAREYGLLGADILGSGFDFDATLRLGAHSFVGGESTAILHAVEGKASEPRPKHIHTTDVGLWGKPSCLNNVKTLNIVPEIINCGAEWYASIGTEKSKGTQVFSLAGKINNVGLVEVPMGVTVRELVFDVGGGIPKDREFKALQIGGPSGGFLPEELLDMPMDYETLAEAGSMMGTGGVIIADDRTCVVDTARYFLGFLQEQSCGKCSPCREGVKRMLEIMTRITEGEGQMSDLDVLKTLGEVVKATSLCGLGKSAPNPVLSTLRYFRDEYVAHIEEGRCPAGVCKALITYQINAEACTGCGLCALKCPQEAISGEKKEPHVIDQEKCIKCGICFDVCKFDAVDVV